MGVEIWLNAIIILAGACIAQLFLIEELPVKKTNAFLLRHYDLSEKTLQQIDDIFLPLLGTIIVLFFLAPQNITAQACAGLTWSTTVTALSSKIKKKVNGSNT